MLCEACHKQKNINQKATAAVLMVIICTEIKWLCDDDYQRFSGMYHLVQKNSAKQTTWEALSLWQVIFPINVNAICHSVVGMLITGNKNYRFGIRNSQDPFSVRLVMFQHLSGTWESSHLRYPVTGTCTHKQSIKLSYKVILSFSCNYECIFVLLQ